MLMEIFLIHIIMDFLGEMSMDEMKRSNDMMRFFTKIFIGTIALGIVLSLQIVPFSQLSFDSNLFQSAVYSLLIFSFWIIAGSILRKPKDAPIKMHSSSTMIS